MSDPRPDIQINFTRRSAADSFIRPNNTTAYTAGDVVSTGAGAILEFLDCARKNGGAGCVRKITLKKSRTGVTNASFRIHLFSATQTAIADNAGWETVWENRTQHLGYADLTMVQEGGTNDTPIAQAMVNLPFVCLADTTKLFGVITAEAAYGPYALEEFMAALDVEAF